MLSKAELNLSTDALTVEQAIEHALAVYEQNDCNMCGRQHKQLANWLTELLSLREQLAELKALEPFGYIDSVRTDNWNYINLKGETSTVAFISKTADGLMRKDYAMPLFTAAKPEALPRHIFSMLVNELRDVPAIGCKRELIVGVLNRHGVIAEPVGG